MRRLTITQHTVRCPLNECTGSLQVRTDTEAAPSRRHRDVAACSLVPAASPTPFVRRGYFSDLPAPVSYLFAPRRHCAEIACSKPCLDVLNAAEAGVAAVRCTSGVADALELVRQTHGSRMVQVLWTHGV